jgi:hypothetical protein
MAESNLKIKITGLEPLKSFLDVLVANIDKLPIEVTNALQLAVGELDTYIYNREYLILRSIPFEDVNVFVNGKITKHVQAGYPISKIVSVTGSPDIIAESFWIHASCGFVCGWGEKPDIACGGEIKGKLKVPANEC